MADAAEKEISQRYTKMMEANKQYVVKDQAKADELFKQWWYTKLSRIPDNITQAQKEVGVLKQTVSRGSELHLNEVGMLALFAGELYAWFVVGEIVGRGGSLVDYEV
jgi:F-type H+-transporting ATPase subunit g